MRLLDWVRRRLGESEDLEAAHQRLMELEEEALELRALATQLRAELGVERNLRRLLTDPSDPPCLKIKLPTEQDAFDLSRDILEMSGDETEPYFCRVCPPQPRGRGPWWHVRSAKKRLRGPRGKVRRAARRRYERSGMRQVLDLSHLVEPDPDTDSSATG